VFEYINSEELD